LTAADAPLVEVRDLTVHFRAGRSALPIRAIDALDLTVKRGQVVGIVGESGCGKTTLGRAVLGIQSVSGGTIRFAGEDIARFDRARMRAFRQRAQMIPQDAAASLSPRFTVRRLLEEVHLVRGDAAGERRPVAESLEMVELGAEHAEKYPHELSGGQARRVSIARALAMEPDLVVADEVTAGLDVSAVASVVNLLARLRAEHGLSYLFISHDLDVVAYLADVIGVMYLGHLVELAPAEALVDQPFHPYTRGLLAARQGMAGPVERSRRRLWQIRGDIPSPRAPPSGCRFHTRCDFARTLCAELEPRLESGDAPGRAVSCHFWRDIAEAASGANSARFEERTHP